MRHPFPHKMHFKGGMFNGILRILLVCSWFDSQMAQSMYSLQRDSMLHTQRHAISPTRIFSKEKTHSCWSTDTQLIHSCMQSQVHSRYPRELLGNRKWQWMEEAVPKRGKIPSDLCHSEEGMREERGLGIYYNERKGQQSIRYSLNKKKERANRERFKSFLTIQGLFYS